MKLPLLFIFTLFACKNSSKSTNLEIDSNNQNNSNRSDSFITKNENDLKDTTGFFSNCQEIQNRNSIGALQGISANKDSLGALCFYECYDCNETFEIIFVYNEPPAKRAKLGYDFIRAEFQKGCDNDFENFRCFAFVYPMNDPDKQKDTHAINIEFPVNVNIYERTINDNWRFIKKIRTEAFKDLAHIQFKTIYHLE